MGGHTCPLCKAGSVPVFRFCCGRCYRCMPRGMRDRIVDAWRARVASPRRYAEALAEVLLWYRDFSVWHQEKRLGSEG